MRRCQAPFLTPSSPEKGGWKLSGAGGWEPGAASGAEVKLKTGATKALEGC